MKERLTGAIILVAVLVLLVPELLSGPGEGFSAKLEGAESSVALRSYTIDLADETSRRPTGPTSASTVVTDEPVAAATPEPEFAVADDGAAVLPGAEAPSVGGSANAAASAGDSAAKANGAAADAAPPSVEDDRPRSAFGPNAVQRPKPAASEPARAEGSAATGRASRNEGGSSQAGSSEKPRPATSGAKPASDAKAASEAKPTSGAKPTSEPKLTKGWAVQLGVFASRENADRLAKQVKGKGYTVSVNETSGNGKRLYRVRVGPEASRPAAVALGTKLRAAGFSGAVVSWP